MKQVVKYSSVAMMVGIMTLGWFGTILAQWPSDPSVNVPICTATDRQYEPRIVADGAGGAIISWYDWRNGERHIYAQRADASGVVQWTADGVDMCTATGHGWDHRTVPDGSGGAIITWGDYRSGGNDIYAQRVDASGVVQWAANGVAICIAAGGQSNPTIAADGSGGAIITWCDSRNGYSDIYAQRINASGVVQWTANGVPICTYPGYQTSPTIAADGSGGAIITWHDRRSGYDIYAQRVDATGVVQWDEDGVPICTAAGYRDYPKIVADGAGGAIIEWSDRRSGYDIYAQRVDASGVVQWDEDGVPICTAPDYQEDHDIAADGWGGAMITWVDKRSEYYGDIYAQRVDASGVVRWATNGVAVCTAPDWQEYPKIVADGSGGAIITWGDYRSEYYGDIYAQRVDASGVVRWPGNGVPICTRPEDQWYPLIATDGSGGAIITWQDYRSGNWDIYAQNVNSDGSLGPLPSLEIVEEELSANYDPPDPWVQREFIELSFEVTAVYGDLTHVRFFSDPLQHEYLPRKIPAYLVEFIPQEIGFLGKDNTVQVIVKVEIPIGQNEGDYSGYFRAICSEGSSDWVTVEVHVDALPDLDIEDYAGNLSANTMELFGIKGGIAVGVYNMVNPNMWETNYDPFDGPANVDLSSLTYSSTDLVNPEERDDPIPANSVNPNGMEVFTLASGNAAKNIVQVHIPMKGMVDNHVYTGTVIVTDLTSNVQDEFTLQVTVVKGKEGKAGAGGFWGESGPEGNILYWSDFGLNETGYALYRGNGAGYDVIAELPSSSKTYTDGKVVDELSYDYKLGVTIGGSEIMIGPITFDQSRPLPSMYRLSQAYPNPLREEASIQFSVPVRSRCSLRLYDASGRLVRTLFEEEEEPGIHSVIWDGKNSRGELVCNGVYFYRLRAGDFTSTKKMVLLR